MLSRTSLLERLRYCERRDMVDGGERRSWLESRKASGSDVRRAFAAGLLPPPCAAKYDTYSQTSHNHHGMGIQRPLSRLSTLSVALSFFAMSEQTLAQNYPSSRALIYSATVDFRHDSIPTAIESLKAQGPSYNVQFDQTEDKTWFTDERLAQYDAVVFLSNSGQGETVASPTSIMGLHGPKTNGRLSQVRATHMHLACSRSCLSACIWCHANHDP